MRVRTGISAGFNGYRPSPDSYYPQPKVYWWSCEGCRGDRIDPSTLKKAHCEVCNYS